MKIQIKKDGNVVREINLTPILDILLIILCIIGIVIGIKTLDGKLAGYCLMAIVLIGITWHPKYRWYFKN